MHMDIKKISKGSDEYKKVISEMRKYMNINLKVNSPEGIRIIDGGKSFSEHNPFTGRVFLSLDNKLGVVEPPEVVDFLNYQVREDDPLELVSPAGYIPPTSGRFWPTLWILIGGGIYSRGKFIDDEGNEIEGEVFFKYWKPEGEIQLKCSEGEIKMGECPKTEPKEARDKNWEFIPELLAVKKDLREDPSGTVDIYFFKDTDIEFVKKGGIYI